MNTTGRLLSISLALASLPAPAQAHSWSVLSRDDGCVPIAQLFRGQEGAKIPASPTEYAEMKRQQGHQVRVAPPPGLPPELSEKVVQVWISKRDAPVFVRDEVCKTMEKMP